MDDYKKLCFKYSGIVCTSSSATFSFHNLAKLSNIFTHNGDVCIGKCYNSLTMPVS